MSEQERKQPWANQEVQNWEASFDDLNKKVIELSKIEKELFWWDGKVSSFFSNYEDSIESNDTEIDKKFKESIKDWQDIKTKIDIVTSLVLEFSSKQYDYHKTSKYADEKTSKLIDEFKDKINNFKKQEPYNQYTEVINMYVLNDINNLDWAIKIYESHKYDDLTLMLNTSYENLIWESLNTLKWVIDYVHNNKKINWIDWKKSFLINYFQNSLGNVTKYIYIDKIMSLDIYNTKEYEYWETTDNLNDDNYLIDFLEISSSHWDNINELYLEWLKESWLSSLSKENLNILNDSTITHFQKLVDYIDKNFTIFEKRKVLKMWLIDEIYMSYKKNNLCIINAQDIPNDFLLDLSEISQPLLSQKTENLLWKYYLLEKNKSNNDNYIKEKTDLLTNFSDYYFTSNKDINIQDKLVMYKIWKKISWSFLSELLLKSNNLDSIKGVVNLLEDSKNKMDNLLNNDKKEIVKKVYERVEKWIKNNSINQEQMIILKEQWIIRDKSVWEIEIIQYKDDKFDNILQVHLNPSFFTDTQSLQEKTQMTRPSSPEAPSETRLNKAQQAMNKLWFDVKVSQDGSFIWQNWETTFKQTIWNRTFEIWNDGKIFIQWAFWYNFKYENNIDWVEKYLEIADEIEYVDHMWLGHFGDSFKEMVSILNQYSQHTWLRQINIDDGNINSTNFINQIELDNISKAFNKIWFLDTDSYSFWFKNWIMEKVQFSHIMDTKFEWNNFFKWWVFSPNLFREIVVNTDWKENKV